MQRIVQYTPALVKRALPAVTPTRSFFVIPRRHQISSHTHPTLKLNHISQRAFTSFTSTPRQYSGGFKPNKQKQHHSNQTPPTKRSGVKYAEPDPVITTSPTQKVVFNSPLEAKRSQTGGPASGADSKAATESVLVALNRIRTHKVYQLTRLFMFGSVFILLTKRIGEAKMLPDEIFEEDDPYLTMLRKTFKKTFRVMLATITRTWTPFGITENSDNETTDEGEDNDDKVELKKEEVVVEAAPAPAAAAV